MYGFSDTREGKFGILAQQKSCFKLKTESGLR